MAGWVELAEHRGRRRLIVDGRPFVALGIQMDFLHTDTVEGCDYLWPHVARMGVNTVFFPVRWGALEPSRGRFDFTMLDHALARCGELDIRMSLLWFATNQGGGIRPVPQWIRDDATTYWRVRDAQGAQQDKLCPACPATLAAERAALEALLTHLAAHPQGRRCILMQIENEPCLEMTSRRPARALMDAWSFRCHCPRCDADFATAGASEWDFSARSMAAYFARLLANQKAIFPALTYVNFLLNPQRPGQDIDIYLAACPQIDIVGVDYYGFGSNDLAFTMRFFSRGRNVPLIAEHSTESCGDAAGNVWRAVCEHGAVAFDPWAIDHTFGWRHWRDRVHERPFVGRDGSWTDAAEEYGRSLRALGEALGPIAAAACTEDLLFYVADQSLPRSLEERRWGMVWRMQSGPVGRWALVRLGEGDFTLTAVQTQAIIEPLDPAKPWRIERGRWHAGEWVAAGDAPVTATSGSAKLIEFDTGACVRIRLG